MAGMAGQRNLWWAWTSGGGLEMIRYIHLPPSSTLPLRAALCILSLLQRPQTEPFDKVPLGERVKHKHWKAPDNDKRVLYEG
jgi:hypothetical protein